jgi:Secretion system C-terminal sorting domain/SprB repeat
MTSQLQKLKHIAFFVIAASIVMLSNNSNPPNGRTGSPFDQSCNSGGCHSSGGTPLSGTVTVTGLPATIQASTQYQLNVQVNANSPAAGYQMVVVDGANANCGTLSLVAGNTQSGLDVLGGRTYVDHRGKKILSGGTVSWPVVWTAPAGGVSGNQIKFYLGSMVVNNDGGSWGDDFISSSSTVPFAAGAVAITTSTGASAVSCNGGTNGSASVNAGGGNGSFTYLWSNNATSSVIQNLAAGTYTVTVTSGGSSSTASAVVTQPSALQASAVGGLLTCANNSVTIALNASGATPPYSFSPGLTVTSPGTYTITITDQNGCTIARSANVTQNIIAPTATVLTNQQLGSNNQVTLNGSGSSTGAIYQYQWLTNNGSILSGANTLSPIVNAAGAYTLRVTNTQNGCVSQATTNVTAQVFTIPVAIAGNPFSVNCLSPSVITLNGAGSSVGPEFNYQWTASAGGSILSGGNTLTPTIGSGGMYNLNVTNVLSGVSASGQVMVSWDKQIPNVSASSNLLTCNNPCTPLTATSTAPGATYVWSIGSALICTPNTYTVTVTAGNGCTNTATTTVVSDTITPSVIGVPTAIALTCTNPSRTITASTNTQNATYSWTGPNGFVVTQAQATITTAGAYILVVTNPVTGCSRSQNIAVTSDGAIPAASITTTTNTINCNVAIATLTGSSSIPNSTYAWTSSIGSTSTQPTITAQSGATFTLTVTSPNGCNGTTTYTINQDTISPSINGVPSSIFLSCANPAQGLAANSNIPNASYRWIGPNGIVLTQPQISISTAGQYTLTATNPNTGCTRSQTINVSSDFVAPTANITSTNTQLSCALNQATLSGSSNTPNSTYKWSSPNGFASIQQNVTVQNAGVYTLEVRAPNGCTATATRTITADTNLPSVAIGGNTNLTCVVSTVTLTASSTPAGLAYLWSNGSTNPSLTVNSPNTYSVTATNLSNGCAAVATTQVLQNIAQPQITVLPVTVTCSNPTPNLAASVSSTTSGAVITTSQANGQYFGTVTGPNGCSITAQIPLINNTTAPTLALTGGVLTCNQASVTLQPTTNVSNPIYAWVTGATGATITVTAAGSYSVTVKDPVNGCSSTASAIVTQDAGLPVIGMCTGGILSCNQSTVQLQPNSLSGLTLQWYNSAGVAVSSTVTTPGTYTLTATSPVTGCTSTCSSVVAVSPAITAVTQVAVANCNGTYLVTPTVTGGQAPYTFTNNGGLIGALPPGTYTLIATDVAGCTASTVFTLAPLTALNISDTNIAPDPGLGGGAINITVLGGSLPLTFAWSDTSGVVISTQEDLINLKAGFYRVTVTDNQGCTVTKEIMVSLTVSTNELEQLNRALSIYPNPANQQIFVTLNTNSMALSSIEIMDMSGRMIVRQGLDASESEVDISQLNDAVYFLKITSKSGSVIYKRLVVSR